MQFLAGALAAVLGRIFAWVLAGLVFRVVSAFGVGMVVFWGVGELFDSILAQIQTMSSGLPSQLAGIIIAMRIDDAIVVIFSAISIRVSLKTFGLAGGVGSMIAKGGALGPTP